jgi:hypothetical protein
MESAMNNEGVRRHVKKQCIWDLEHARKIRSSEIQAGLNNNHDRE